MLDSNRTKALVLGCACSFVLACTGSAAELGRSDRKADYAPPALLYPVVLHHGFNAGPGTDWGFGAKLVEGLQADHPDQVFESQVNPYDSSEGRAAELCGFLRDHVLSVTGAAKAHCVAHSQGGLDCRVAAQPGEDGCSGLIASVTTVSSPHGGTAISDLMLKFLDGHGGIEAKATDLFAAQHLDGKADGHRGDFKMAAAHRTMAEAASAEFNAKYPGSDKIVYLSWAGISHVAGLFNLFGNDSADCNDRVAGPWQSALGLPDPRDRMSLLLEPIAAVVSHGVFHPNDGVVTVSSARFEGRGNRVFRGCVKADHMAVLGQGGDAGTDEKTGFDPLTFYRLIFRDLAVIDRTPPQGAVAAIRAQPSYDDWAARLR